MPSAIGENQPSAVQVKAEDVSIRPAVVEDCPAMLSLIKELALYEKSPESVTVTLAEMESCGFGANPVWGAFVAEWTGPGAADGKEVIGMALYYYRYSTWRGRMLYLEDFVVRERCRGGGVGRRLFDRVIDFAKEQHCHGMVWQALDWNEPALNFYRKYDAEFDPTWVNCMVKFDF